MGSNNQKSLSEHIEALDKAGWLTRRQAIKTTALATAAWPPTDVKDGHGK